jgi:hypothetical protein
LPSKHQIGLGFFHNCRITRCKSHNIIREKFSYGYFSKKQLTTYRKVVFFF